MKLSSKLFIICSLFLLIMGIIELLSGFGTGSFVSGVVLLVGGAISLLLSIKKPVGCYVLMVFLGTISFAMYFSAVGFKDFFYFILIPFILSLIFAIDYFLKGISIISKISYYCLEIGLILIGILSTIGSFGYFIPKIEENPTALGSLVIVLFLGISFLIFAFYLHHDKNEILERQCC